MGKWWEIVCSVYRMITLQGALFQDSNRLQLQEEPTPTPEEHVTRPPVQQEMFRKHKWWDHGKGWKNILNNLRLVIQPYVYYCLLYGWLELFNMPFLKGGFTRLIALMHEFTGFVPV